MAASNHTHARGQCSVGARSCSPQLILCMLRSFLIPMSNAFVSLYLVSVPRVQSISLARAFSHATRTASFAQSWNSASGIDTSRRKEEQGKRMTQTELASFPGSSAWAKRKKAWYTLFAHAQISLNFWEFGNFCKICSATPTSTRYADFSLIKGACHWPRSVWTMTKKWRLQELSMCSWIPAEHCSTWQSFFEVHQSLQTKQCRLSPWKRCSRLKNHPYKSMTVCVY